MRLLRKTQNVTMSNKDVMIVGFRKIHGTVMMIKGTKIPLDANNRMIRIGCGLHEGKWFFRIDCWWFGFRITGANNEI